MYPCKCLERDRQTYVRNPWPAQVADLIAARASARSRRYLQSSEGMKGTFGKVPIAPGKA